MSNGRGPNPSQRGGGGQGGKHGGFAGPPGGANRHGAAHGKGGPGGGDADVIQLLKPPAQHENYFKPNSKTIRVELLDEEAQKIAEQFKDLPNTQLRRFFVPVVALRLRAQAGKLDDAQVKAELAMMKARAAYAYKRPGQKVPAALVQFFTRHAASADTPEKLIAFARHFEAVVAYHRVYNPN